MRKIILLVALVIATSAGRARAQAWDSRGWVLLGEREVNGKLDHDRIEVGAVEGTFSKVTMVVQNSDLELVDFQIVFADKTTYHPKLTYFFKEGARTRAIDLPPAEPVIRSIDFKYRNVPGGGRAKVQIWGWRTGGDTTPPPPPPPPPAPTPVTWNNAGWTLLGEREVNGNYDHDRIAVSRAEGKFTKLTIVVQDSDLELVDLSIKFGRGPEWHPAVSHYFKEGQRTRQIDFPGDERVIKFIDFKYRNLPGGGRAKVAVWGKPDNAPPPAPPPVPAWDSRGWTMLGERVVDGNRDRDRLTVGRYEGKFTKLMIVVLDSDLELNDLSIKFGRGPEWHPDVKQVFRENQRTRAIDFPGDERVIKYIDFRYRNLPGGGRAKVQVWAKADTSALVPPPPPAWDSRGWQLLGERVVDGHGREDTDHIEVGRAEGKFSALMLVVLDSDLEIIDFLIKFKKGAPYHPEVKALFKEGTRTRAIDLPGNNDRIIKWLEFKYRNLPGGGRAKIQVWGK
jgi:hypothetical protein